MISVEPDSAHLMRRCTGRRATLTPRRRMVLRQCVFQHREAHPDGLRSWVEVRRTVNDVEPEESQLVPVGDGTHRVLVAAGSTGGRHRA
jgi:hypothetical protein